MLFKNDRGTDDSCSLPAVIDQRYRGALLDEILAMPRQIPISLESAMRLADKKMGEAFFDGKIGREPGENAWYQYNFVRFISDSGFHIELTGDEFDFQFSLKTNH